MGVVEVTVELCLATIDQLIPNILDVREAVDSLVVSPSLHPEVEFVRANARFQPWRFNFVDFPGWALLGPCCVGPHVGVEEGNCDPDFLMARDGNTVMEGARQLWHLRRLQLQFLLFGIIKSNAH